MEVAQNAKKRKPIWWRMLKVCLAGCATLLVLLFVGVAVLLTPKRLTPIAERLADNLLIADVRFDTLRVSLFQEFPYINITVVNGHVRSRAFDALPLVLQGVLPQGCDSLLRFEELSISLHLRKLFQSQIDIRRVRLRNTRVNAYVSPFGIANWDVYLSDTTEVNQTNSESFHLNLQRLIIRDGFRLSYRSDPDSLSAFFQCNRLFLRGDIGDQWEAIKIETLSLSGIYMEAQTDNRQMEVASTIDSLRLARSNKDNYSLFLQSLNSLSMDKTPYATELPIAVSGEIGFSLSRLDSLAFKDFNISAAQMPVWLDGSVVFAQPQLRARLDCRMDSLSAVGILGLIPPSFLPEDMREIHTDIQARITASIDYPSYTLDIRTSGGYLYYPATEARIHTLALDASYTYRPDRPELSGIDLRQCDIKASGIELNAKGYIQNPLEDPNVDLSLQGNILLDTLYRILPFSDQLTARGALSVDATAKFLWSNLLKGDMSASTIRGRVEAERLLFRLPKDSILIMARGGHLSFGANQNQRDTLMEQGTQILRLSFRADSANIRYKQQFRLSMGNTRLSARSAASALDGDSTQIHPFTGSLETRYLSLQTADSTRITLKDGNCDFSLLPLAQQPSIPVVSTHLQAQFFQMSDAEQSYELLAPKIALQATRLPSSRPNAQRQETQRREGQRQEVQQRETQRPEAGGSDSLPQDASPAIRGSNRQARTSERVPDELASGNLDFEVDEESKRLLRQWQLQGSIQTQGGALSTPYFPLPISLGYTDLEISTEEIQLMQTQITAGHSQIECTGRISNLRQVLLGRGSLEVYGFIRADTLDINELMRAANAGAQYADSGTVITDLEDVSSFIIIPANLRLDLKLFSDHTRYEDEYLTGLSGALTSRNRSLQINDLEASSSFGDFRLSALYATHSRNNITAGFDLDMKKVQVERLIALLPSIDTLAPMLRSFEGVVDCQISATTAMDTEMNILLPTLKAACRIQGENMVLLDGETFTEISKMLQFRNRNRNLIEHISVDFLIRDSQVEVFPFIVEMDRYRAAVSGVHKFDMTFDYHISVLRSPLPFRLGINVTGNLDNPHYRLTRTKYRNANIPSYVELIDETRISLLEAIKAFDPTAAFRNVERSVARAARMRQEEAEEEEEENIINNQILQ